MRHAFVIAIALIAGGAAAQGCPGTAKMAGNQPIRLLADGSVLAKAKLNINIDGSGRAYNFDNSRGLIHLCNGARVHPAGRPSYEGSESNATCTGKFMTDLARIRAAGWSDGSVGGVEWFGVVGTGSARVNGRTVTGVKPAELPDGFLVSPTTLADPAFAVTDQRRYVEPLTIATAVIPTRNRLTPFGVRTGTLGVAFRADKGIAVPFIVSDLGPRIGEGSPALARRLAGIAPDPALPRSERFVGAVSSDSVTWVFFGGDRLPPPYTAETVETAAKAAFERWGGLDRLRSCARVHFGKV
ncbi:hypothetical protein [Sandaracinobacteroides saxicola]|uniref:Uncharacterized protein n=1 Tax=Sandaracinobacteroides saxicola TaxID=2759707 RepID=A0A7G5IHB7_9SPHN|nr:hypothetical protein [Sandaracinobacteroides saxicola]QMW22759.1 hypothetical protein H3309_15885 [Sandaracinobacteroides saxicola]